MEKRRNYFVSEPNYHTKKFFIEILITTELRKTQILINKQVYLSLSILELSKTVMYEFWYDYINQNMYDYINQNMEKKHMDYMDYLL